MIHGLLSLTMAPYIQESAGAKPVAKADLQPQGPGLKDDKVSKPVADDFMYDFKYNHKLPTTDVLGIEILQDCDAAREAEGIVARLSTATSDADAKAFAELFLDYGKAVELLEPRNAR
jgi:hypothetical protein